MGYQPESIYETECARAVRIADTKESLDTLLEAEE